MGHHPGRGIDREGGDPLRGLVGDLLDVHAALGRGDERNARGRAVDQRREVELLLDRRALFDVEPVDHLALGAGLVGDEGRAENACRLAAHVGNRLHDLDAARLAAAAGVDLRLDDPDRTAELVRGLLRLLDRECRDAVRHRHAEFPQNGFRLVLVNIHDAPPVVAVDVVGEVFGSPNAKPVSAQDGRALQGTAQLRFGAIFMQASTKPPTESTDLSNIACSAPVSSISTIRSTPLAPSTTGTPT